MEGKKKIKDEDLGTISGGCGSKKKPEPKYHAGQKVRVTFGPNSRHAGRTEIGTIYEAMPSDVPEGHFDYMVKFDLDGDGSLTQYILCLEKAPGCWMGGYMVDFQLV